MFPKSNSILPIPVPVMLAPVSKVWDPEKRSRPLETLKAPVLGCQVAQIERGSRDDRETADSETITDQNLP